MHEITDFRGQRPNGGGVKLCAHYSKCSNCLSQVFSLFKKEESSLAAGFSLVGTLALGRITLAIVSLAALAGAGAALTAITSLALTVRPAGTVC